MRSTACQSARRMLRAASHEVSKPQTSRAPYICPSCRSTATLRTPRRTSSPVPQRTFSTAPPKNQETASETTPKEAASPRTHYHLFPETFPGGPPPNSPFSPDLKKLRKEFLQLQAKAHPDLASSDKKRQAEALSAHINEAYKTLQDPLRRARYLLAQQGIDVEDESAQISDNALLMEVMEAREAVEEVEEEEDLVGIREENEQRIEASVRVLEECFAKGEMKKAAEEAIKLRYWMNIEESIHGWEKGKGGGMIHH